MPASMTGEQFNPQHWYCTDFFPVPWCCFFLFLSFLFFFFNTAEEQYNMACACAYEVSWHKLINFPIASASVSWYPSTAKSIFFFFSLPSCPTSFYWNNSARLMEGEEQRRRGVGTGSLGTALMHTCNSQNHRMLGIGRDLWGSSGPTPLPKQGHLQQAAQDLVQVGLEYLQRRRLHSPSGQPVAVLCHPQSEEVLPRVLKTLGVLRARQCRGWRPSSMEW